MDRKVKLQCRLFVVKLVSAATMLGGSTQAWAEAKPMVNEADAQAVNLNDKADATTAKHAPLRDTSSQGLGSSGCAGREPE